MSTDNQKYQFKTIRELLCDSHSGEIFKIPAYQRQYTWTIEQEIQELIDDIKFQTQNGVTYYLGSLVTCVNKGKTQDVIDGQQRLTTLWLLLQCLKTQYDQKIDIADGVLRFDEVRDSANTFLKKIEHLKNNEFLSLQENHPAFSLLKAFNGIKELLSIDNLNSFVEGLLDRTQVLCLQLPEQTDVSLFFERMNDRGEQMEEVDLIKARLMEILFKAGYQTHNAEIIWSACQNMNSFVQSSFLSAHKSETQHLGEIIFGEKHIDFKLKDHDERIFPKKEPSDTQQRNEKSLSWNDYLKVGNTTEEQTAGIKDKFIAITDFPHLLVHVLGIFKQFRYEENKLIPLTTNRLYKQFEDIFDFKNVKDGSRAKDVMDFLRLLLRCRYLLDTFLIKSFVSNNNRENWILRHFRKDQTNGNEIELFNTTKYDLENKKDSVKIIRLILSLLHCSFTSREYKNWLDCVLRWLNNDYKLNSFLETLSEQKSSNFSEFLERYSDFLRKLAFLIFYLPANSSDTIREWASDPNSDLQNFICPLLDYANVTRFHLNYIDYLIYEKYSKDEGMNFFGVHDSSIKLSSFRYSTSRTSVDHFIPRNPRKEEKELWQLHDELVKEDYMDGLVNLSLMSPNQNSRHLNDEPSTKSSVITKKNNDELPYSLKTQILAYKIKELEKDGSDQLMRKIPIAWKELQKQFKKLISEDSERIQDFP